jgi:dipeptidyl aminopeptidase/acylaminoacyl peptidase
MRVIARCLCIHEKILDISVYLELEVSPRINEDANVKLKVYEQATGREIVLPRFSGGEITDVKFSPSERLMSFYLSTDRSPDNLYLYDFVLRQLRRLTDTLNKQIVPADLVESEVIRYKSFDGMDIPALLFKPHQANARNKVPALVFAHGAPGGQTRKGYRALFQYLINHGYAVLAVNQRGSQGYGKTFFSAAKRRYGREPLWDMVESKRYLHTDKIRKPLLVLQGANDPRVPKVESDDIVEAVKKNGGTVEYLLFPDEGHGFSKKANEIRANKVILDFLNRYLKKSELAK